KKYYNNNNNKNNNIYNYLYVRMILIRTVEHVIPFGIMWDNVPLFWIITRSFSYLRDTKKAGTMAGLTLTGVNIVDNDTTPSHLSGSLFPLQPNLQTQPTSPTFSPRPPFDIACS